MIPVPVAALVAAALTIAGLAPAVRAPLPPPPPPSAPAGSPCPEWFGLFLETGWPEDQWPTAARVMRCESGCSPAAYNRSGASGLMQVMPSWFAPGDDPFDPTTNLAVALAVWHRQGWRAWSCY